MDLECTYAIRKMASGILIFNRIEACGFYKKDCVIL